MEKGLLIIVLTLAIVLMLTPFYRDKAEALNGGTNSYTYPTGNNITFPSFSGGSATYSSLPTYGNFSGSSSNFGSLYGNVWNIPATAAWNPVGMPSAPWNPLPIGPDVIIVPSRVPSLPDIDTISEVLTSVPNPLKNLQWPGTTILSMLPLGTSLITYPGYNTYPQIVNMLPQIPYPNYTIDLRQLLPNFPNMPSFTSTFPLTLEFDPYLN